jgi:glucose-6-phosphate isomerase
MDNSLHISELQRVVSVDLKGLKGSYKESEYELYIKKAEQSFDTLVNRVGRGEEFLGWLNLPSQISDSQRELLMKIANDWKSDIELVVVVGIGGSYLGSKAALEALSHHFSLHLGKGEWPQIVFAGQNLSGEYLSELTDLIDKRSTAAIVISKSGTTTEPAVAFRLIKRVLGQRYSKEECQRRVVAITDKSKGALKKMADDEGYLTFVIPDDVGGRYSVLTPVGLLPLAVAGMDVNAMIEGAATMEAICAQKSSENPAIVYAALRNLLYSQGKKIEILVNYNPKLQYFSEWWKQLFGESEGKEGRGIFPASVNFTSDLHSMGQYIQEGERTIFETVISVDKPKRDLVIESDQENLDGLNFLSGKTVEECNKMAELGTMIAHMDGGVPNIKIGIPALNEYNIGALFYFFEFACGISAYMLDINPFDQPGVEDYKRNMFALLGKPGFEELAAKLRSEI